MKNSVLEVKRTDNGPIAPESKVVFNEQLLYPTGIDYDNTTGIITFKEIGQYSIKWWVATETTLKGAVGFHLLSSQGNFTPGCSPVKMGQVTGFGVIDVETVGTTLSLVNKSISSIMVSRKAGAKAYLLVTPITPSSIRVYHGNLSTAGSSLQAPLGNGLYYRLEYVSATQCRLILVPMNGTTLYDYKRFSVFEAISLEGDFSDSATLNAAVIKDPVIYNNSREMHWVLIRVQNPISNLWSMYEVRFFISGGGARTTLWVNVIEEEVRY